MARYKDLDTGMKLLPVDLGRQQCPLRKQCLRNPDKPAGRQVTFFRGKAPDAPESATARMKRKIDSPEG
jgi:hypothetical protein